MPDHPLEDPAVVRAIERAASTHRGSRWTATGFTDLNDRASHPCGILHGRPFSVFAKVDRDPDAVEQFTVELAGHDLIRRSGGVATPEPVGDGLLRLDAGAVLLLEAVTEVPPGARTADQWRDIGRAFAILHRAHADRFGLRDFDGFFGPLRQDNRPVQADRWADFYAERRLLPRLRDAVERGRLDADVTAGVERLIGRLPELCGPEPVPSLVHG
ncbi:MAG TPA: fructosamine kinase family protein, partial [Micromonosporaceae bacterium]